MDMVATAPEGSLPATAGDAYTVRQVARLFDLPERKLRYWSQTGFIKPSVRDAERSFYSFRDLIAVKVAKALLDAGVPLRRVRRSLSALAEMLPDVSSALSALRIQCQGDRVIVEHADGAFEAATGQLVLDFDVATLEREVANVLALPWVDAEQSRPETAYEWFLRGNELEEQWGGAPVDTVGFEAARQAYARALELDPELAAAWTNLGSMLAEVGEFAPAREHFERALQIDPDQPEAQCNLAEIALRDGETDVAIVAYRGVLRLHPDWIEAHYGLARALLEVGGKAQALAHLERFCAAASGDPELQERRESALEVIGRLRAELP
jgi:tetratricopeptide (TPR) repeat protein